MATLEVADEGKGVPLGILNDAGQDWTRALGVGLRGMNERMRQLGGTLNLSSSERGTTVSASVPKSDIDE
jgi:two-component system NarL family sensor kinase